MPKFISTNGRIHEIIAWRSGAIVILQIFWEAFLNRGMFVSFELLELWTANRHSKNPMTIRDMANGRCLPWRTRSASIPKHWTDFSSSLVSWHILVSRSERKKSSSKASHLIWDSLSSSCRTFKKTYRGMSVTNRWVPEAHPCPQRSLFLLDCLFFPILLPVSPVVDLEFADFSECFGGSKAWPGELTGSGRTSWSTSNTIWTRLQNVTDMKVTMWWVQTLQDSKKS